MAMAFASKGPIQMGRPVLFDKSIKRTTNPFDVESKVKNFTFISTNIPFLLSLRSPQKKESLMEQRILIDPADQSLDIPFNLMLVFDKDLFQVFPIF
jgi:hypothetical protein